VLTRKQVLCSFVFKDTATCFFYSVSLLRYHEHQAALQMLSQRCSQLVLGSICETHPRLPNLFEQVRQHVFEYATNFSSGDTTFCSAILVLHLQNRCLLLFSHVYNTTIFWFCKVFLLIFSQFFEKSE
jgi:hypothetical protein